MPVIAIVPVPAHHPTGVTGGAIRFGGRNPLFGLLVGSKLFDAAATAFGLGTVPILVERTASIRALMGYLGLIPGLVVGSVVVLALVYVATELGVRTADRYDPDGELAATVRAVGYGSLTLVFTAAGLYNLQLVYQLG